MLKLKNKFGSLRVNTEIIQGQANSRSLFTLNINLGARCSISKLNRNVTNTKGRTRTLLFHLKYYEVVKVTRTNLRCSNNKGVTTLPDVTLPRDHPSYHTTDSYTPC